MLEPMGFYIPLSRPRPLPNVDTEIESAVQDWKAEPAASAFERAKDVAAFANHYGGTLLLGAIENSGRLARYCGLTRAAAGPEPSPQITPNTARKIS